MSEKSPVIAIVAGEKSGDILGADLIRNLRCLYPNAIFEGIGGAEMISEGFNSIIPLERLSVMGFIEPLKRISELINHRKLIINRYLKDKPLFFIGIDSPDFNSKIELKLKLGGIKTVHYVSPSVWAWRSWRIKSIKKSIDLMLTLFPFENKIYEENKIPVKNVGHPLAKKLCINGVAASNESNLRDKDKITICLMPGSRSEEVKNLARIFLNAVEELMKLTNKQINILIPAANSERLEQLTNICNDFVSLSCSLFDGDSHDLMRQSDIVLLASGTTALEAMLLNKPMVVAYKLHWLTYLVAKPFIKTKYVSIPNLLAHEMLVPELLQDQATSDSIAEALRKVIYDTDIQQLQTTFHNLSNLLIKESGKLSALRIKELLD